MTYIHEHEAFRSEEMMVGYVSRNIQLGPRRYGLVHQ